MPDRASRFTLPDRSAPLRAAVGDGPPRLRQLAADRLASLLPGATFADETAADMPLVEVRPDVVVDAHSLGKLIDQALERGVPLRASARGVDGALVPGGATAWPEGQREAASVRDIEWPIGLAVFEQPDDHILGELAARIFAPAHGVSGYATASRNLMLGLRTLGVDLAWQTEWGDIAPDAVDPDETARLWTLAKAGRASDPLILYRPATNADGTPFFELYRERRTRGPAVACTMFETDALPARWPAVLNTFDQVWVPSTFNRRTFTEHGVDAERLRVVPIGLDMWAYAPDGERMELPERRATAFFSAFEWSQRKGADVLLRAWAQAFRPTDDVVLYLRTGTDAESAARALQHALDATGLRRDDMAPIGLLHTALSQTAYRTLIRSIDAFVLTSRGEGFCIPMLEAMALGKPVIGTIYGGSSDFLDEDTGFVVPSRLVPVAREFAQRVALYRGQRWADPSVETTARAMVAIVRDPDEARRRSARAFARAHEHFDRVTTARHAAQALAELPRQRTETSFAAVTIRGPATSASESGETTRDVLRMFERRNVAVSLVEPATSIPVAALAPQEARNIGRARRRHVEADVHIAVDEPGADADIIYLTSLPELDALTPRATVWVPSDELADAVQRAGVSASRIHVVAHGPDVGFWTPDGSLLRPGDDPPRVLIGLETGWREAIAAFFRAFGPSDRVAMNVLLGEPGPTDLDEVRRVIPALFNAYGQPNWEPTMGVDSRSNEPAERSRALGAYDIALATRALPTPLRARMEAIGIPIVDVEDLDGLRRFATDELARATASRALRAAALAHDAERQRRFSEVCDQIVPIRARRERPVPLPRVVIAAAAGCSDAEVAAARDSATFAVADAADATHVAVVDGGVDLPPGWDAMLVEVLEQRPAAALASTSPPVPNENWNNAWIFRQGQGELRGTGPVPRGARLARADETRIAPIWVAFDVIVIARADTGAVSATLL